MAITSASSPIGAGAASALGQEDFLKILLTQLSHQDPLKPMDNQAFIAQMAQLTALEQSRQLSRTVADLLAVESTNQALALLGREIEFEAGSSMQAGRVSAIAMREGVPWLTIQTATGGVVTDVALARVALIRQGA